MPGPLLLLGALLVATVVPPSIAIADLRARDVRVEFAQSPVVGVAVRRPRFSWALEHVPEGSTVQQQRGSRQACFRVSVIAKGASQPVWDSGTVLSNNTLGVRCGVDLVSDLTDSDMREWLARANVDSERICIQFSLVPSAMNRSP